MSSNAETTKILESLDEQQQKIKFRERDLNLLVRKNLSLKQEAAKHLEDVRQLELKAGNLEAALQHRQKEKENLRLHYEGQIVNLKAELETLNATLQSTNQTLEKMTAFKTAYDTDKKNGAGNEMSAKLMIEKRNMDALTITRHAIVEAENLRHQMAEIINEQLNEFENNVLQLRKKKEILSGVSNSHERSEYEAYAEQKRDMAFASELHELSKTYNDRIQRIQDEITSLNERKKALKHTLIKQIAANNQQSLRRLSDDNFRQFATTLWYSTDNGKSYTQYTNLPFCAKCADRPIFCPHRLSDAFELALPTKVIAQSRYASRNALKLNEISEAEKNESTITSTKDSQSLTSIPDELANFLPQLSFMSHLVSNPKEPSKVVEPKLKEVEKKNEPEIRSERSLTQRVPFWTHVRFAHPTLNFQTAIDLQKSFELAKEKHRQKKAKYLQCRLLSGENPVSVETGFPEPVLTEDKTDLIDEHLEDVISEDEENESTNTHIDRNIRILWREFYRRRGGFQPLRSRQFSLQKVVALIYELWEMRFKANEDSYNNITSEIDEQNELKETSKSTHSLATDGDDEPGETTSRLQRHLDMSGFADKYAFMETEVDHAKARSKFIDFFYKFMEERYVSKNIALQVIHDVFAAVQAYEAENRTIALFLKQLVGEDESGWEYCWMVRLCIQRMEKFDVEHFRKLLRILYPYRVSRDLYEKIEVEFISFSKNRFTKDLTEDFMRHMVLTKTEPNIKAFAHNLKKYDYTERGYLTSNEFMEALSQIYPPAPSLLKRRRYQLAEHHFAHDQVSVDRLAMMSSYLLLHTTRANKWEPPLLTVNGDTALFATGVPVDEHAIAYLRHGRDPFVAAATDPALSLYYVNHRHFSSMEDLNDEIFKKSPEEEEEPIHDSKPATAKEREPQETKVQVLTNEELDISDANDPAIAAEIDRRKSIKNNGSSNKSSE